MAQNGGNVQELAGHTKGHAHQNQGIHLARALRNHGKGGLCFIEQLCLPEQVAAGVTRKAQLGQHHHLGMRFCHFADARKHRLRISCTVGNRNRWRCRGNRDESVPHNRSSRIKRAEMRT